MREEANLIMIDISIDWIDNILTIIPTVAAATVFGAMLGAILPSWLAKRRLKRSLRRALRSEIEQIDVHQRNESYLKDHLMNDEHSIAPTTVFEENAGDIGMLSDAEIESVVTLYSTLDQMRGEVRSLDRRFTEDTAMERVDDMQDDIGKSKMNAIEHIEANL